LKRGWVDKLRAGGAAPKIAPTRPEPQTAPPARASMPGGLRSRRTG